MADKDTPRENEKNSILAIEVIVFSLILAFVAMVVILNNISKPGAKTIDDESSSHPVAIKYEAFTDTRDGKTYKSVVIGSLIWMAENLDYRVGNSWCYDNDEFNCKKYGRLYDWNTARVACPSGWHLPSKSEWNDMIQAVGSNIAGKKLKSRNGWDKDKSGTDNYGFSALPGGRRFPNGKFRLLGESGNWWTSSECSSTEAYYRYMYSNNNDFGESNYYRKLLGFSVRCVKNEFPAGIR